MIWNSAKGFRIRIFQSGSESPVKDETTTDTITSKLFINPDTKSMKTSAAVF